MSRLVEFVTVSPVCEKWLRDLLQLERDRAGFNANQAMQLRAEIDQLNRELGDCLTVEAEACAHCDLLADLLVGAGLAETAAAAGEGGDA